MKKMKPLTEHEIHQLALTCSTRTEFNQRHYFAVRCAKDLGIYEKVASHMTDKRKNWTKKKILDEAAKYRSRKEFQERNMAAYHAARYHNILEEACAHMKKVRQEASDSVYIVHLPGTDVYKVGITSSAKGLTRVNDLEKLLNHKVELLIQVRVPDPRLVEKYLLHTGKYEINIPEGIIPHSELRSWTPEQFARVMRELLEDIPLDPPEHKDQPVKIRYDTRKDKTKPLY